MKPGLDRRHGPPESLRERLAARPAGIDEQDDRAFLLIHRLEAVNQRREPFGTLARRQRVDLLRRGLEALRLILERNWAHTPHLVERTVAGDGRHPGKRRTLVGVEFASLFPDAHIDLLKRVRSRVASGQYTGDDPIEFRICLLVERRKRGRVARSDTTQELAKIVARPSRRWRSSPDRHCGILDSLQRRRKRSARDSPFEGPRGLQRDLITDLGALKPRESARGTTSRADKAAQAGRNHRTAALHSACDDAHTSSWARKGSEVAVRKKLPERALKSRKSLRRVNLCAGTRPGRWRSSYGSSELYTSWLRAARSLSRP